MSVDNFKEGKKYILRIESYVTECVLLLSTVEESLLLFYRRTDDHHGICQIECKKHLGSAERTRDIQPACI